MKPVQQLVPSPAALIASGDPITDLVVAIGHDSTAHCKDGHASRACAGKAPLDANGGKTSHWRHVLHYRHVFHRLQQQHRSTSTTHIVAGVRASEPMQATAGHYKSLESVWLLLGIHSDYPDRAAGRS